MSWETLPTPFLGGEIRRADPTHGVVQTGRCSPDEAVAAPSTLVLRSYREATRGDGPNKEYRTATKETTPILEVRILGEDLTDSRGDSLPWPLHRVPRVGDVAIVLDRVVKTRRHATSPVRVKMIGKVSAIQDLGANRGRVKVTIDRDGSYAQPVNAPTHDTTYGTRNVVYLDPNHERLRSVDKMKIKGMTLQQVLEAVKIECHTTYQNEAEVAKAEAAAQKAEEAKKAEEEAKAKEAAYLARQTPLGELPFRALRRDADASVRVVTVMGYSAEDNAYTWLDRTGNYVSGDSADLSIGHLLSGGERAPILDSWPLNRVPREGDRVAVLTHPVRTGSDLTSAVQSHVGVVHYRRGLDHDGGPNVLTSTFDIVRADAMGMATPILSDVDLTQIVDPHVFSVSPSHGTSAADLLTAFNLTHNFAITTSKEAPVADTTTSNYTPGEAAKDVGNAFGGGVVNAAAAVALDEMVDGIVGVIDNPWLTMAARSEMGKTVLGVGIPAGLLFLCAYAPGSVAATGLPVDAVRKTCKAAISGAATIRAAPLMHKLAGPIKKAIVTMGQVGKNAIMNGMEEDTVRPLGDAGGGEDFLNATAREHARTRNAS